MDRHSPRSIAERLAKHNIFVWDGHYYALEVIQRPALAHDGGMGARGPSTLQHH